MPDEVNVTEIAESIGNDLFGAGDSGTGGDLSPGSEGGDAGSSPTQQTFQAANPLGVASPSQTPAPIHPMPKAWKKDKEELWKSLTPAHQEYLIAREQDVLKGLEMYSGSHKQWNELVQPFQPILQKHPDVNPVQVLQQLMRNHLALVQASPEQKRELANRLLKSYGIDLSTPGAPAQGAQPQAIPPEIASRLSKVDSLEQTILTFQRQQQEAAIAENTRLVEAFAKDPKNEYFEEVADDIARFLQTGAAADLASAYELACYANPAVRAKIIAKTAPPQTPPKKPPTNLDGSGEGTPITRKPATIDDTINSVIAKHYGQAH